MPRGDQTETEKGARAYSNQGSDLGGYVLACSRAWAGILTSSSAHLQSQAQLAFLSGFGSQPVSHTSRGAHSITTQAGKPVHSPVQVLSIASTSFNFPLIRKLDQSPGNPRSSFYSHTWAGSQAISSVQLLPFASGPS